MTDKVNLVGKTLAELEELAAELGEPKFRAEQIFNWVYNQQVADWVEMTNLSKELRRKLAEKASIARLKIVNRQQSQDGTEKFLLELADGERIETVYLPMRDGRKSLCVSTQVGCAMGCNFCATGQQGLTRDLTAGEIINQILTLEQEKQVTITNIVLMGMGEPLANYREVMKAIRLLNHDQGLNIGSRRITVSTCGLVPEIKQLAQEGLQLTLAVSFHAPTDDLRSEMMPINERYPLAEVLAACDYYSQQTGRRVSFEYALVAGVNDSRRQAEKLAELLQGQLAHVNLIPINQVTEVEYSSPPEQVIADFKAELAAKNISATVRTERGADINAACGQLKSREG